MFFDFYYYLLFCRVWLQYFFVVVFLCYYLLFYYCLLFLLFHYFFRLFCHELDVFQKYFLYLWGRGKVYINSILHIVGLHLVCIIIINFCFGLIKIISLSCESIDKVCAHPILSVSTCGIIVGYLYPIVYLCCV